MSGELEVINDSEVMLQRAPKEVVAEAEVAAKVLKDVITQTKSSTKIGPKEHIHIEGWQTVAKFYGLSARIVEVEYVEYGDVKGFNAKAEIVAHSGHVVSAAESMCMTDEKTWANCDLYAIKSMAQTRACGKAFRNCLSWVVVLAGYSGTPMEEMPKDAKPLSEPQAKTDGELIDPPNKEGDATAKQLEAIMKLLAANGIKSNEDDKHYEMRVDVSQTLGFNAVVEDMHFLAKAHASILIPALGERLDKSKADSK